MVKWNKTIRAKMWAEMVKANIERQRDIQFTKTLTKYFVAIGGIFLMCLWSFYFVFNI